MRKKKTRSTLPPLIRKLEIMGISGQKVNGIPGKYLIGYKLASKVKKQHKEWFINSLRRTAKESRVFHYDSCVIDWDNPYTLTW